MWSANLLPEPTAAGHSVWDGVGRFAASSRRRRSFCGLLSRALGDFPREYLGTALSTYAMNKELTIVIMACVAVISTTSRTKAQQVEDKVLQSKFDQLQGFRGDPIIQFFRDSGQPAVGFLAQQMESKDAVIRVKAAGALRAMGPQFTASGVGFDALSAALNQSDIELQSIAEGALGDLGPKAKAAVPGLIKCVSGCTNINGVWALGAIGPEAKAALPVLESKMRQKTGRERVYAAGAVWNIGGTNAEARTVIKNALEDQDRHVRIDATNILRMYPGIGSR